ncbi:MAG TPA: hypothetical protein VHN80_24535 [Kineosporiaceae bacterium]|nr:hypothetical protein [Kineosporiaceae bacterium]
MLRDFLLDNVAGSCFVLGKCEKRRLEGMHGGTVDEVLGQLAVRAFADVLALKADQGIEMALSGHLG